MVKVILAISDSDKHFAEAIEEYKKRLPKQLKIVNIKPIKHGSQNQISEKETDTIISYIDKHYKNYYKILLSKTGRQLDTYKFKDILNQKNDILFIIGGPYGLKEDVLSKHIDYSISFGAITMPHGLAKLVLLEQIYRSYTLQIGKKYHY